MTHNTFRRFEDLSDDAIVLSPIRADLKLFNGILMGLCNGQGGVREFILAGSKIRCYLMQTVVPPKQKPNYMVGLLGTQPTLEEVWWVYLFIEVTLLTGNSKLLKALNHFGIDAEGMTNEGLRLEVIFAVTAQIYEQQVLAVAFDFKASSPWIFTNLLSDFMTEVIQGIEHEFPHAERSRNRKNVVNKTQSSNSTDKLAPSGMQDQMMLDIYVPKREPELVKWQGIWRHIKDSVDRGIMAPDELKEILKMAHNTKKLAKVSDDTLRKIIKAGRAGKL